MTNELNTKYLYFLQNTLVMNTSELLLNNAYQEIEKGNWDLHKTLGEFIVPLTQFYFIELHNKLRGERNAEQLQIEIEKFCDLYKTEAIRTLDSAIQMNEIEHLLQQDSANDG